MPQREIPAATAEFHYGTNLWPNEPENLQAALTNYMQAMEALGKNLLRLFAAALSLPQDYFVKFHNDPMCALRCLNYPGVDEPLQNNQQGAA